MKRVVLLAVVVLALLAAPALAVNDPLVPGDECSASDTAVGHPAFVHERSGPASPPFSANNPGQSTGAKAAAHEQGTEHCPNG
jgi:hypothetical protein